MPLALVTGTRPHLGPVAATLARAGFIVMTWEVGDSAPPAGPNRRSFAGIRRKSNAGTAPDGPFDCYVQLPCAVTAAAPRPPAPEPLTSRDTPAARLGRRAADDLVCRVDALAAVAGRLKPNASILLAVHDADSSGDAQPGSLAPDLLAAVALALLEDLGQATARLAVLSVAELSRRTPASTPLDSLVGASQWEMPTPPLVSAP